MSEPNPQATVTIEATPEARRLVAELQRERFPLNWTAGPELFKALADAQAETENPSFDSVNPHFRTPYASLASVRNAVFPPFAKHGLAIIQDVSVIIGAVRITTILTHSSGQWIAFSPLDMPLTKADPQSVGAAETYGRRYAILAVAGVSGERDEDAEPISGDNARPEPKATSTGIKATAKQVKLIETKLDRAGITVAAFCEAHQLAAITDMAFDGVNAALDWIAKNGKAP